LTYCGKEKKCFTKLFWGTNVKIVYRTTNNIRKILAYKTLARSTN
jgi:hypothetical protein